MQPLAAHADILRRTAAQASLWLPSVEFAVLADISRAVRLQFADPGKNRELFGNRAQLLGGGRV
jgi:hypothetical protein